MTRTAALAALTILAMSVPAPAGTGTDGPPAVRRRPVPMSGVASGGTGAPPVPVPPKSAAPHPRLSLTAAVRRAELHGEGSPNPATAAQHLPDHWLRLADCESGEWDRHGNPIPGTATWDATDGVHEGGLQFAPETWDWLRPTHYPDAAYDATPAQQVAVAERVLEVQGWGAWPVCSVKVGLREASDG